MMARASRMLASFERLDIRLSDQNIGEDRSPLAAVRTGKFQPPQVPILRELGEINDDSMRTDSTRHPEARTDVRQ